MASLLATKHIAYEHGADAVMHLVQPLAGQDKDEDEDEDEGEDEDEEVMEAPTVHMDLICTCLGLYITL